METTTSKTLAQRDGRVIWHPYTQSKTAPNPIAIDTAQGAYLYGPDGTAYLDAISSWWVILHGHGHPHIKQAIRTQLDKLEHVMFNDYTHEAGVGLAEKLTSLMPADLTRVFYSDNGSTAVETGLKMALQYHHNLGRPRTKLLTLQGGFHGETIATMSLSARTLFSRPFEPVLLDVTTVTLENIFDHPDAACFCFEPYIQGVGGMRSYDIKKLDRALEFCHQNGIVTIADEVMTGFGRTGPDFVANVLTETPDVVCLAKPLTGGFLPLGATVVKERLFEAFLSNDTSKALLHGHSYCGNPIACAAALANLEVFDTATCRMQRRTIEEQHTYFLEQVADHRKVKRCEVVGTIFSLEFDHPGGYFSRIRDKLLSHFLERKVLVRPFGSMLHIMPPYCIRESELETIYRAVYESLDLV